MPGNMFYTRQQLPTTTPLQGTIGLLSKSYWGFEPELGGQTLKAMVLLVEYFKVKIKVILTLQCLK